MDTTNYNEDNHEIIDKLIESTEKIIITNYVFKSKLDKYVWDSLPLEEEDKKRILEEILNEHKKS